MASILCACTSRRANIKIYNKVNVSIDNFYEPFREYNQMDSLRNYEANAIISSFCGSHEEVLKYASKDAPNLESYQITHEVDSLQKTLVILKQREVLLNSTKTLTEKSLATKIIRALERTRDLNKEFRNKTYVSALKFIETKSKAFHYTLINEAHYSSANRAFTSNLLLPLWKNGYRYLALEALDPVDSLINNRGYPLKNSGYYLKESSFGNLAREALEIGFKLIPYESILHEDNVRDSIQAINIYSRTLKLDPKGKVLVHAGYGHISEMEGAKYKAMGYYLKKIIGQDILSIDQQTMMDFYDESKVHPYYRYASNQFQFNEPVVFVDSKQDVFIDPVNLFGIDIQVYHPKISFAGNRPSWLISNKITYELPESICREYRGFLMQIIMKNELLSATPIDQFIVKDKKVSLTLTKGEYQILFIDKKGSLTTTFSVTIQ